jgi:tripartite-type tricarboxylate transporter receptor subunit TctC
MMGAWAALVGAPAAAQDNFPSRPIRVVIPYGPGTVADVFGRIVAQNMAAQWNGATIVFESKSGANGSIAAEDVAYSAPDGYTWLLATTFFVASPALDKNLRWDPQRDFAEETREKLDTAGCEARSAPLAGFADIIRTDVALWVRVVKEAGIPVD